MVALNDLVTNIECDKWWNSIRYQTQEVLYAENKLMAQEKLNPIAGAET